MSEIDLSNPQEYSTEGCSYGDVSVANSELRMFSSVTNKPMFQIKLETIAQYVVPANNRDEIEIQFLEPEKTDRYNDGLVQMTLHFPAEEDEDTGMTLAESLQKEIKETGVIRHAAGSIITEFSKEQGNFVTPRGKYAISMYKTYLHMQGAQYAYKISYDDINSLFLLPKLDGGRMAFVISLEKPIRQGNQKYLNLVIETHKLEHTLDVNLTEDEFAEYEGQLTKSMTMPMSSLIAKVFKVLSQKKVFIPKQYISAREAHCVRCAIKANDGLLYPLAKSFIFINKPCIIIKFEDIEFIEFKRYEPNANSATRNFDMAINVKDSASTSITGENIKEYIFMSIDRSEYASLFDYINSKEIKIKNPQEAGAFNSKTAMQAALQELDGGSEGDEDEDDGDYEGGGSDENNSASDDNSESSGSGSDNEGEGDEDAKPKKKKQKVEKSEKPVKEKAAKKQRAPKGEGEKKPRKEKNTDNDDGTKKKKKRAKKDKNAPKGASSSYIFFSNKTRASLRQENPTMKLTEIAKELGNKWKNMTSEEKEPFEELARQDKERYNAEMKIYKESKAYKDFIGGGDGGDNNDDGEDNNDDNEGGDNEDENEGDE